MIIKFHLSFSDVFTCLKVDYLLSCQDKNTRLPSFQYKKIKLSKQSNCMELMYYKKYVKKFFMTL